MVLVFYPEDWSPVCSDQLALYQELLSEFRRFDAEVVGISVDGIWCHLAFAKDRNLHFPLLADFEPKGEVAREYGVYRSADGTTERALYVIDADGIVRWSYVSPVGVNPGADGILRALESLRRGRLVSQTQWIAALTLPVDEGRDHIQGPPSAPVTLVEYGDYECPYCGAAYPILKEVQERMAERLRFVFRNFPISTSHPHAEQAAEAAEAAAAQGRFWEMHDTLYENQNRLTDRDLHAYAVDLELDVHRFDRELAEQLHAGRVREDFMSGVRSGVNGTPTFYVNGARYDGSYDLETLLGALEQATKPTSAG